jgi:DNA-directed RNA polymerase subunit omega
MKNSYLEEAAKIIPNPNILINLVSRRVRQLRMGMQPLVDSLETLSPEDIALLEIIQGKITYELTDEMVAGQKVVFGDES